MVQESLLGEGKVHTACVTSLGLRLVWERRKSSTVITFIRFVLFYVATSSQAPLVIATSVSDVLGPVAS